ncbi:putative bifunctional lysylphosphatidylglycerol flippase/synthetase [Lysobacter solisilvae (ex Woo and Kim 2020)]|uniref:UPF0104 family protein n=1 Tax=Agrilutibacter terrestris TaxID=2865112 RepID=A0A7H0FV20_9GAMM|nr:YbhN family protein [Lysobacter terrestris]QNP39886.1 UPF0104 family protein [Lysobacter terrestris]
MKPRHPLLHRLRRIAWWLVPVAVLALVARAARAIDWRGVGEAMAGFDPGTLLVAALLSATSYLVYCGYELAARHYAHHALSPRRTALIGGIAYALGLNIGALFGATGARLRLYTRAGLGIAAVTRIVAFATSTNWLGYLLLAGALFASGAVQAPSRFAALAGALPWLGAAMLAAAALYLLACWRLHGRMFHVRGHHFRLPSVPLALLQFALAALNWALMAAILYVLLPAAADYPTVLGALLLAAVATALVHVPGGVGVLEAVFVAALAPRIPVAAVLAALFAYRTLYYLLPLAAALPAYLLLELRGHTPATATGENG